MTAPINQQIQPLNTPSKPQSSGPSGGRNQKDRRYMDTFWDNHRHPVRFPKGRPWCGPREIAANRDSVPVPHDGFCIPDLMQGEYVEDELGNNDRGATFASVWYAPWRPLAKYFRFHYQRKLISFEYGKMILDERKGIEEYYQASAKLGARLGVRVKYGELPDFQITSLLGEPTKYLKIAEAALAGDPWLLGFIDEPNPELAAILGYNAAGLKVMSYEPPAPVATPQQVLATPDDQMLVLIEQLKQQNALLMQSLSAAQAQQAQPKGRKRTKASSTTPTTSNPAGDAAA